MFIFTESRSHELPVNTGDELRPEALQRAIGASMMITALDDGAVIDQGQ